MKFVGFFIDEIFIDDLWEFYSETCAMISYEFNCKTYWFFIEANEEDIRDYRKGLFGFKYLLYYSKKVKVFEEVDFKNNIICIKELDEKEEEEIIKTLKLYECL